MHCSFIDSNFLISCLLAAYQDPLSPDSILNPTSFLSCTYYFQVSKMEKCPVNPDKWKLYQYNEFLGYFDAVVIAHNGKCADRLMSTAGD
jgi:hypothetical protein